ncbi:MAG: hypothetical protein ACI9YE_003789 [Psychroserpens sp.]|jgi:hypothetical protein
MVKQKLQLFPVKLETKKDLTSYRLLNFNIESDCQNLFRLTPNYQNRQIIFSVYRKRDKQHIRLQSYFLNNSHLYNGCDKDSIIQKQHLQFEVATTLRFVSRQNLRDFSIFPIHLEKLINSIQY